MSITVAEAKAHLNIGFDDDDTLIGGLLSAATTHAERYLRREFAVEYPDGLPAPIRTAILQHVAAMFRDREATQEGPLTEPPLLWKDLLSSYRVFS
ncbi:head-tail connector protein [Salipiger abyssi]|uniref:Phage gp6-like head-tail connector protein n=1 Tax=Salipiger abyssi TaxID=1250539 RepID=A0A1P8UPD1_9RHOB|nr:head-tail connector protein [Salipiger abyssi]APZ51231.1 Phage gp6-like head-tail connector protein [Salipiger abyssi]